VQPVCDDPLGVIGILDFSELTAPGLYQVHAAGHRSHPFFLREDLYTRTAYQAFLYSKRQRCGIEVPGWHQACHLDDGQLPDGTHRTATGGWHDAGDLRKWVDHTLWQAIGICWLKKRWKAEWRRYGTYTSAFDDDLLDELEWGNRYFLGMIDIPSGALSSSVGGPESDNHWTDNVVSEDDRHIDPAPQHHLQFKFAWIQQTIADLLPEEQIGYAEQCRRAAHKAREYGYAMGDPAKADTLTLSLAALSETDTSRYQMLLDSLLARQFQSAPFSGAFANGADTDEPFWDWWQHSFVGWALFDAAERGADRAEPTLRRYLDFIKETSELSAFGILPLYLSRTLPTENTARRFPGGGYYRFFLPVGEHGYGQGSNTALLGHAALFAHAHHVFEEPEFMDLALRQLEWVYGANSLGLGMVSGQTATTPYPHSRYTGIIPCGILNGISGTREDEPHLGSAPYDLEWQTKEYWSPQQAQYLMTLCELFVEPSPGVLYCFS
jgi:hypothetical protein